MVCSRRERPAGLRDLIDRQEDAPGVYRRDEARRASGSCQCDRGGRRGRNTEDIFMLQIKTKNDSKNFTMITVQDDEQPLNTLIISGNDRGAPAAAG